MVRCVLGCTPENSGQCTDVSSHATLATLLQAGRKQDQRKYEIFFSNCAQCCPVSFILTCKVAAVKYSEYFHVKLHYIASLQLDDAHELTPATCLVTVTVSY